MNLIEDIKADIKMRCESPNNFFGKGCYDHIESVARHAVELAKQYHADIEVCEIAGWLHDIASITDYALYESHHIHGAQMAEAILSTYDYPEVKIEKVKQCILNHRGSVIRNKMSIEEICVADADAISHYDNLPALFYLAYVMRKMDQNEGVHFVRNKLIRSYDKMSEKSKLYYKDKREQIYNLLG
ncbi:HD domain-containing protein [Fusibacter sp. Q10-2]|uniref:HD domain-containing protein n=2 Tax=Fusibacter ferrireducens TaxID=2785058 RepID=A0ABR9ZW01_9FIRM|nr:HD domain-containing protein [Fusibacter ferrireducens]